MLRECAICESRIAVKKHLLGCSPMSVTFEIANERWSMCRANEQASEGYDMLKRDP